MKYQVLKHGEGLYYWIDYGVVEAESPRDAVKLAAEARATEAEMAGIYVAVEVGAWCVHEAEQTVIVK